jgi:hypothetical protein
MGAKYAALALLLFSPAALTALQDDGQFKLSLPQAWTTVNRGGALLSTFKGGQAVAFVAFTKENLTIQEKATDWTEFNVKDLQDVRIISNDSITVYGMTAARTILEGSSHSVRKRIWAVVIPTGHDNAWINVSFDTSTKAFLVLEPALREYLEKLTVSFIKNRYAEPSWDHIYMNEELGLRCVIADGWNLVSDGIDSLSRAPKALIGSKRTFSFLSLYSYPTNQPIDEFSEEMLETIHLQAKSMVNLSKEALKFAGQDAVKFHSYITLKQGQQGKISLTDYVFTNNGRTFVVTSMISLDDLEQDVPAVDKMLASVELVH